MKPGNFFSSKKFKFGAVSTAISVIFIALIVVVNVVATVLTDKFPLTIDLTPNSAFALSEESIAYVKGVTQPVNVYVLSRESDLENSGNLYYTQVKRVIDQYAQYNGNISVSYVDIVKDPTFTTKYPELSLNYGDVLVESGERRRTVSMYDMFNVSYNQQTGQQYIRSSKADEMMTSAIMGVTSDEVITIGILSGHEEEESPALRTLLEKNNFQVVDVNLQSDEIDPSIEVLFWNAPKRDPDESLFKKLDTYLENGMEFGRHMFYTASSEQPDLPNVSAFLEEWGIAVDGGVVAETNSSNVLSFTSPFFCTVEYTDTEDYLERLSQSIRVTMPFGRPLRTLFDARSGYETKVLLSYSPTSVVRPADAAEDWAPTEDDLGEVPAMVRGQRRRFEGTTLLASNLFVLSSSSAFDQNVLESKSVNNADYLMSILNTITEREDVITIAPKDLSGDQLGVSLLQAGTIAVIMVILVPLAIIIIGLVIWIRRRHM